MIPKPVNSDIRINAKLVGKYRAVNIAADYLSERDRPIMPDLLVPILIAVCGESLSVLSLAAVQAVNGSRLTTEKSI